MKTMTSKERQLEAKRRNPLVKDFPIISGKNDLLPLLNKLKKEEKILNQNA
jgi:hypothetical protein